MTFLITDYGAVGDGCTDNTKAIQNAINDCHTKGGGRVIVPHGVFRTGTVILKDNVDFHIEADGVLLGSPDCADYPERTDVYHVTSELLPRKRNACLIFADEATHIALTGSGTIDCNGTHFVVKAPSDYWMPYMRIDAPTPPRVVFFTGCSQVKITDISMVNQPAGWSYWIHDCEDVTIDRLRIDCRVDFPNNDGIHINCSRRVSVSNCRISCGDDSLVVRANSSSLSENKVCEGVTVTNCTLTSHSGGIRIGWINDGTIRNCTFSNIVMTDTTVGISLYLPDRSVDNTNDNSVRISDEGRERTCVENLSFSNIVMDRMYSCPIYIHLAEGDATHINHVGRLYFDNIHARGLCFPYLIGRKDCPIRDVTFSNCSFEQQSKTSDDHKNHGATVNLQNESRSVYLKNVENVIFNATSFCVTD